MSLPSLKVPQPKTLGGWVGAACGMVGSAIMEIAFSAPVHSLGRVVDVAIVVVVTGLGTTIGDDLNRRHRAAAQAADTDRQFAYLRTRCDSMVDSARRSFAIERLRTLKSDWQNRPLYDDTQWDEILGEFKRRLIIPDDHARAIAAAQPAALTKGDQV